MKNINDFGQGVRDYFYEFSIENVYTVDCIGLFKHCKIHDRIHYDENSFINYLIVREDHFHDDILLHHNNLDDVEQLFTIINDIKINLKTWQIEMPNHLIQYSTILFKLNKEYVEDVVRKKNIFYKCLFQSLDNAIDILLKFNNGLNNSSIIIADANIDSSNTTKLKLSKKNEIIYNSFEVDQRAHEELFDRLFEFMNDKYLRYTRRKFIKAFSGDSFDKPFLIRWLLRPTDLGYFIHLLIENEIIKNGSYNKFEVLISKQRLFVDIEGNVIKDFNNRKDDSKKKTYTKPYLMNELENKILKLKQNKEIYYIK